VELGTAQATVVLNQTAGGFYAVPAAPGATDIWHYRDEWAQYFLRLPAARGGGEWLAFSDGQPLADRFRSEAYTRLESLFSPELQAITDHGTLLDGLRDKNQVLALSNASCAEQGVSFDPRAGYAPYTWELFLHVPLLIADHLCSQQRFEDAQQWLHFVFNPTTDEPGPSPSRYWRFLPFRTAATPQRVQDLLAWLADPSVDNPEKAAFRNAIETWKDNPFRPHAVARLRPSAYQWSALFSYLDLLLGWGDDRFRRDTRETISEASLLYILAAKILGPRPQTVAPPRQPPPVTYRSVAGRWDDFSNTWLAVSDHPLVRAWLELRECGKQDGADGLEDGPDGPQPADGATSVLTSLGLLYFCVPDSDKLAEYRNRVEDRLFKIRHCQNIDGLTRDLPSWDPPIDPELLIRAVAAGVDLDQVVAGRTTPLPPYRFGVLVQKANELCAELKALGANLLAALQQKDAERLAQLRSGQEIELLELITQLKQQQIDEATLNVAALGQSRRVVAGRYRQYQHLLGKQAVQEPAPGAAIAEETSSLQFVPSANLGSEQQDLSLIQGESLQLAALDIAMEFGRSAALTNLAGALAFISGSAPMVEFLQGLGHASTAVSGSLNTLSSMSSGLAGRDALLAGYQRRRDEWVFQSNNAARELAQIDQQIAAGNIRVAIAERDLANHLQQIENARTMDAFMHDKYTNEQLYTWMSGQLATVYFATYRLALDIARRAERAMCFELGLQQSSYVRPSYWDTLKKGLLAGEQLAYDLKRMEVAYLDQNRREYELTKHVSLLQLDPLALVQLKQTGTCEISLPETLFDLDCPGHYLRRIKSVALSIPSVVGPYTSVNCRLTLLWSSIRHQADGGATYQKDLTNDDRRFTDDFGLLESVVTSSAVNDPGLWEPNLHDERRLPCEGRGAISTWRLELPNEFRQFDYDQIADAVLHLRYTARDGGQRLRDSAVSALHTDLANAKLQPQARLISLRNEFPSQWARITAPSTDKPTGKRSQAFPITKDRFPYLFQDETITIRQVDVLGSAEDGKELSSLLPSLALQPVTLEEAPAIGKLLHCAATKVTIDVPRGSSDTLPSNSEWTVSADAGLATALHDLILVMTYTVEHPKQMP
jgi:hypothetical protein